MAASPGLDGRDGQDWRDGLSPPGYRPAAPACPARPALNRHRLAHDLLQRPALAAAERTRFDDFDCVADFRRVLLVVHHELRRPALGLAVEAVTNLPFDGDDAALLHPVTDDDAHLFCFRCHL